MYYTKTWGGTQPGCLIFLLDQSGSMDDPFGGTQVGGGRKKSHAVALVINNFLDELITTNITIQKDGSNEVRPRAEVAIIGYGGNTVGSVFGGVLEGSDMVSIADLQANPLAVEKHQKRDLDDEGNVVMIETDFPIWVKPQAHGGTPMYPALLMARDLAEKWAANHPDCYPPVVINITDGMAQGDLEGAVKEITRISTNDGQALFFSVHITSLVHHLVEYPTELSELPEDPFAQRLFFMSSIIPDTAHAALDSLLGRSVPPTARGMIFNGDASSVKLMFNFASAPALQHAITIDPDR
jgi:hypothetical protein